MTDSWPFYKQEELYHQLLLILQLPRSKGFMLPKQSASVLGKLQLAIQILPWGEYIYLSVLPPTSNEPVGMPTVPHACGGQKERYA
jgi:hypothetical protein